MDRDICSPSTSLYTRTCTQSRGLRFLSSTRQWRQLCTLQFGPPNVSLHTQLQLDAVSHIPLLWQGRLQTMGIATGTVLLRVTHTGAVERITGTSVTITRNWPKEGVHDIGCCGRIASRDKHPFFLVCGSCRVHNVDGGYRLSIHFQACSRFATGTGVYHVRQRSDVDLVENSVCIESGQQHFGHVAEGLVTKFPNATCGTSMMLRTSSNRCPERCGRLCLVLSEIRGRSSLVPSCL